MERYAYQFRRESWVERIRGQAQRRLGDLDAALASLKAALEKKKYSTNLLALAHFYLEQGDPVKAEEQLKNAIEMSPKEALCLLSQAVLLWEKGEGEEALEKLAWALRKDQNIARIKDLEYQHFWGPKSLAAVKAMQAHFAMAQIQDC